MYPVLGVKPVIFYSSSNNLYNIRFNHQDHVTTPPKNTAVLASSAECQYAMLQQGAHTLTMQFHPEFTLEHHEKVLNRIKILAPGQCMSFAKAAIDTPAKAIVPRVFIDFFIIR